MRPLFRIPAGKKAWSRRRPFDEHFDLERASIGSHNGLAMSLKTGGVATAQLKAPPTAQQSPGLANPPLRATVSSGAVPPYAAPRANLISPEPEEPRTRGSPPPFPSVVPAVHPPQPQARESQISIIELDDIEADSIPPLPPPSPEMVAVPIPLPSEPLVPSVRPELSERTQVSPARARAMRVIVAIILAACLAIMVVAGRRILQRRDKNAAAPEPTAGVVRPRSLLRRRRARSPRMRRRPLPRPPRPPVRKRKIRMLPLRQRCPSQPLRL
jgi:hypothetical protein